MGYLREGAKVGKGGWVININWKTERGIKEKVACREAAGQNTVQICM